MASADITVVTPCIPPRACPGGLLDQAILSVREQVLRPAGGHVVILDVDKAGAAATRQRGLDAVRTEWVAFLDDDDTFYPNHLDVLHRMLTDSGALYAYSWFDGNNPFPMHRGRQMDIHAPHHTTMTVMVKTEIAQLAGFANHEDANEVWPGEDWRFELRCIEILRQNFGDEGATKRIVGTPEITWTYRVHGKNTSGLATRW